MAMHEIIENATGYDELLAGPEIPVLTRNLKLKSGKAYKRGMLISYATAAVGDTEKKGEQTTTGKTAEFVLMRDVDATEADAVGTVYLSGRFHREKMVLAEGDSVEAHEDELRLRNIYFTTLKS
jgi:hypothetical protein